MNVLVTGGTGLVGGTVVPALVRRGHRVRIASRHAGTFAERLRGAGVAVETVDADVTVEGALRGAADGCEVVIHLVGVIAAHGDEATFRDVNVGGTRRVLDEAERAGVRRFVHVSALGADRGTSEYQRSKLRSEELVRAFPREWVVLRPGGVYGPRDQVVTLLLRMLRTSPVVPIVGDGRQPWQPIWHEDLAEALVAAAERDDAVGRVLEVAGDEVTTPRDLVVALAALIHKRARFVRLPASMAPLSSRVVARLGLTPPLNEAKLTMLLEGNVIAHPERNALAELLGIEPTPLDVGLRRVVHALPLQLPETGTGPFHHHTYRAPVAHPRKSPEQVIGALRERCVDVMPIDFEAEPGGARCLDEGATLTLRLPGRGNMLMRVVEVAPRRVTIATVEGHAIAGAVRFEADESDGRLGFVVDVYSRASNWIDRAGIGVFGRFLQDLNWRRVARNGAALARGKVRRGVVRRTETLRGAEARRVERAIADLGRRVETPETMA